MKKTSILALLLAIVVGLTGCSSSAQSIPSTPEATAAVVAETVATVTSADLSQADLTDTWDESTSTKITLNGISATVEGSGATANGGVVTITTAGTYVVSGTLSDGQIIIDATKNDKVQLILNGADITSLTGAAIYAPQCDKLIVTLAPGTSNTLTDGGANFQYALVADEEPNAALFSKDDLTINGTGALTVNAGFNNGIGTKDDLLIVDGQITINAANHGLRGNDSVTVVGGNLQITAGNDGIQTNNAKEAGLGYALLEGGTMVIISSHDGIQTDTALTITGGTYQIAAGGGVGKAITVSSSDIVSDSFKGLKAGGDLTIAGGTFTIDSYDDSVHANGNVNVTGGTFTLSTADDGMHADGDLSVLADVNVTASYEGLEGTNVTIAGGTIRVVSDNDGINAAGGGDTNGNQGGGGGRFGGDVFRGTAGTAGATGTPGAMGATAAGDYYITVTGGDVTVIAGEDGLDANGSIRVSGGHIVAITLAGGGMGGTGALDCDGEVTVNGGTIIYGGTSMMSNPGGASTQSYVYVSNALTAGSVVSVQKDGKTLASYALEMDCQVLAISSTDIAVGQTYDVYSGTTLIATATAGMGGGNSFGGPGGGGNMGGRPTRGN